MDAPYLGILVTGHIFFSKKRARICKNVKMILNTFTKTFFVEYVEAPWSQMPLGNCL